MYFEQLGTTKICEPLDRFKLQKVFHQHNVNTAKKFNLDYKNLT